MIYGKILFRKFVPVAQWIEQSRPKGKIGGSTPLGDARLLQAYCVEIGGYVGVTKIGQNH